jgi:glyoxylase-like metal-dependent hydrolase (beta-lactamase superfamily II)
MAKQISVESSAKFEGQKEEGVHVLFPYLAYQRLVIVNVMYYGMEDAGDRGWVLIDAGVHGSAGPIRKAAARRFGKESRPAAIILTHGHFDHVGALADLAEEWDVPVYAHPLEAPYLDGSTSYPAPDPSVGGGMMTRMSPLFPRGPINVKSRLQMLPHDGSVPFMSGWRWIHTAGHTPGHVSLWYERDQIILAGDAFITTRQESAYAVLTQRPELHGPPMYFTQDWQASRESVRRLAALNPDLVVSGHGPAMAGAQMREALHELAERFDEVAVPKKGKYVDDPAIPEDGSAYECPT